MSGTNLADIMTLAVGGQTAIQIRDYSFDTVAKVDEQRGRFSTVVKIAGEGDLISASTGAFAADLVNAAGNLSPSGADVSIKGLNGDAELSIIAAQVMNGGPHCNFQMLGSPVAALNRKIKFTVEAEILPPQQMDKFSAAVKVRPDKLREVTRTGEVRGLGASNYFTATVLANVRTAYPVSQWILAYSANGNATDDLLAYAMTLTELVKPLPAASSLSQVTDGEATINRDIDEQHRLIRTSNYQFTVIGDPQQIVNLLRPKTPIYKEALNLTQYKELRMSYQVVELLSGDNNDLLEWNQTISVADDYGQVKVESYPGALPDFYVAPRSGFPITQTGSAKGLSRYPKPADPVLPPLWMVDKPSYKFSQSNPLEYLAEWTYNFIYPTKIETTAAWLAQFERPAKPLFLSGSASNTAGL